MKKYFFKFGYIGSKFSGVQKNTRLGKKDNSITRYLEESLLTLNPLNTPVVYNSSRTDAGVHAICSTFHSEIDLPKNWQRKRKCKKNWTQEYYITKTLNSFFKNSNVDIRIHSAQVVPAHFHCRHAAIGRTYLYRLAHFNLPSSTGSFDLPLPEVNRCLLISGKFDLEAIESACTLLKGYHDFRHFAKLNRNEKKEILTQRTLTELKVVPGRPLFPAEYDPRYSELSFWDVIVSSRSFLYNQVRRIVGLLLAVGRGSVPLREVEDALLQPETEWNPHIKVVEPDALYLTSVEYPPEAFLEPPLEEKMKEAEAKERAEEDLSN